LLLYIKIVDPGNVPVLNFPAEYELTLLSNPVIMNDNMQDIIFKIYTLRF